MSNYLKFMPNQFIKTDSDYPFTCTFNPNPDYAMDCLGTTNNRTLIDKTEIKTNAGACFDETMTPINITPSSTPYPDIKICIANGTLQTYHGFQSFVYNNISYSGYTMSVDVNQVKYFFIDSDIKKLPYDNPAADITKAAFSYRYTNQCVDKYGQKISAVDISNDYTKVSKCYSNGGINTYHGYVSFPSSEFKVNTSTPSTTVTFGNILSKFLYKPATVQIPDNSFSGYIAVIDKNECFYLFSSPTIAGLPYLNSVDLNTARYVYCRSTNGPKYPAPSATPPPPPPGSPVPAPSPSKPPIPDPPPPITRTFTLYPNKLPINIPSTVTPFPDDLDSYAEIYIKGKQYSGDAAVNGWWLTETVPADGYNDQSATIIDGKSQLQNDPSKWTGFLSALSKCIQLDGSLYPPCGPSSTPSTYCSTPSKPKTKANCHAVSVQSGFTGISPKDDSIYHQYNYHLVELPNSSPTSNIDRWVGEFAKNKQLDTNYLFCQPQFYTWVKNPPRGTVHNRFAPDYKNTPSPSNLSSNFSCPAEKYPNLTPEFISKLKVPPGFWSSTDAAPPKFWNDVVMVEESKVTNKIYIGIGVVIVIGLAYWFYSKYIAAPDDDDDVSDSPIKDVKIPTTNKGGYFYY